MRFSIMLLLAALFVAGCSSSSKKETEAAPAESKATATKATGTAETASNSMMVQCSTKTEKRSIEVKKKGKGCELAYTKGGAESVVATAVNGTSHCEKVMGKMRDNLKSSGYTCQ